MAKDRTREGVNERGGYESGPKQASELTPPPDRPGVGAMPSEPPAQPSPPKK